MGRRVKIVVWKKEQRIVAYEKNNCIHFCLVMRLIREVQCVLLCMTRKFIFEMTSQLTSPLRSMASVRKAREMVDCRRMSGDFFSLKPSDPLDPVTRPSSGPARVRWFMEFYLPFEDTMIAHHSHFTKQETHILTSNRTEKFHSVLRT